MTQSQTPIRGKTELRDLRVGEYASIKSDNIQVDPKSGRAYTFASATVYPTRMERALPQARAGDPPRNETPCIVLRNKNRWGNSQFTLFVSQPLEEPRGLSPMDLSPVWFTHVVVTLPPEKLFLKGG